MHYYVYNQHLILFMTATIIKFVLSLSTVVLNSRDPQGNLWLP